MPSIKLNIYSTSACHLCDLAKSMLEEETLISSLENIEYSFEEIDIAKDDLLFKKYGLRIPVVALYGSEYELSWPFDLEQLIQFIQSAARVSKRGCS